MPDFIIYHLYRKEGDKLIPCGGRIEVDSKEKIYPALEEKHNLKIFKPKGFLVKVPDECIIIHSLSGVINGEIIEENNFQYGLEL